MAVETISWRNLYENYVAELRIEQVRQRFIFIVHFEMFKFIDFL